MARLPSEVDLARRPTPANSPGISVPKLDYGPVEAGARALGSGIGGSLHNPGIAQAIAAFGAAQEDREKADLDRRLLDFRLETEMDLEQQRRAMPPGGQGYAVGWLESYQERARAFVGEKYANIPQRHRSAIETRLVAHETALHERAQRDEWAERDRKSESDLEVTLGRTRSAVEADPTRLDAMHAEGAALIAGAQMMPAKRQALALKYRATLEEAAATSIADGVRDAESYRAAKEALAPHKAERITSPGVRAEIKREADGMAVVAAGSGARFRVAHDHAERFQGLIADLEAAGVDIKPEQSGGYARRNIAGTNTPSQHASGRAIDLNWTENARGTAGRIDPELARSLAAKHGLKWGGDWKNPDPMHFEVDAAAQSGAKPVPVSRRAFTAVAGMVPPGATEPETYDGPFANLSIAKRRAIFGRAEAQLERIKKGMDSQLKEYEAGAAAGRLPSSDELSVVESRIRALDDDLLKAKYTSLLQKADLSARLRALPASAIRQFSINLEDGARARGTSKEIEEQITFTRKMAEEAAKEEDEDLLTRAHRAGIEAPFADGPPADLEPRMRAQWQLPVAPIRLQRLGFDAPDIDQRLDQRIEQAKAAGRYYGKPEQVFTEPERKALRDSLKMGGDNMIRTLGKIAAAAERNGIAPSSAMREFSKDAPEVGVIGQMIAAKADPAIVETAAKALQWRVKEGERFVSTIDKLQAKPDLDQYGDVLAATPTRVDAVRATTNLIYEYEARRANKQTFDAPLYLSVLHRVMGQTTLPDGTVYGGVGKQGAGWWPDGKWGSGWNGTPKALVPAEVRQDSFDTMLGALRMQDLAAPPLDADGRPYGIAEVRQAAWVSVGDGRYRLVMKTDPDGTKVTARNAGGRDYELDIRSVLPAIKRRAPEIFRGWDGVQRPEIEAPAPGKADAKAREAEMQRRAEEDQRRAEEWLRRLPERAPIGAREVVDRLRTSPQSRLRPDGTGAGSP